MLIIDYLDLAFTVLRYISRKFFEVGKDFKVSGATILWVCRTISYLDFVVTHKVFEFNLTVFLSNRSAIRHIIGIAQLKVVKSQPAKDVTFIIIILS